MLFRCILVTALAATLVLVHPPLAAGQASFAVANLRDADGHNIGTVGFDPMPGGGVWVIASFCPDTRFRGQRGFHLHERGSCEPDFSAAGDHFNPAGNRHGVMVEGGPHAGDFPNLHFPAEGPHVVEFPAPQLSLVEGDPANILEGEGTAVVMHERIDDYHTQPDGDAGGRVACGVVRSRN